MTRGSLHAGLAASCAGLAAWCACGTLGTTGVAPIAARVALLPPWWWLPALIGLAFAGIHTLRLTPSERAPLFGTALVVLPWLPVPLPPAAMLWTGPFAAAVWVVALVGVVVARAAGRADANRDRREWLADPIRAPWIAAALALVVYGASAAWLSPVLPDGDAPHYLILAQSLIKDGDLQIENNHKEGDYLAYSLTAAQPDYLRRGQNGAIYSIHAPGLPVVITPAMWLFGYPGVVAFLAAVAALSTALVWSCAYRLTGSAAASWFGWASAALTTPFVFQATQVFPDALAATCLLVGLLPMLQADAVAERPPADRGAEPGGGGVSMWLLAGASLAVLPWLQTRLALLAAAAAVCVLLRARRLRQAAAFVAVPIVSALAWFGFFEVVYGTWDPSAPYGPYTQTAAANLWRGLPGLLFDQQFGLFTNAPIYAFTVAGVAWALVMRRRWAWELLAIAAPYVAGVGMYQMWWGGASVPARFLTPLTLVAGVVAARLWHDSRTAATKSVALLAVLVSVLIAGALLVPEHGRLLLNFRDGVALWLEWANDLIDLPKGVPSLFHDDPARVRVKIAIWTASLLTAWLALLWTGRLRSARPATTHDPRLSWPTTWTFGAAVMIALTLSWRVEGAHPRTPATSAVGLLRRAASPGTMAFDAQTGRIEPRATVLARVRVTSDTARRPPGRRALLVVREVPAGTYALSGVARDVPNGRWSVRVGEGVMPLREGAASDFVRDGLVTVRLPTAVRSLVVEGDQDAVDSLVRVELRPVGSEVPSGVVSMGAARRAARYGPVDAFFLDDDAYPEPTGFWVAGNRTARVVLASATGTLSVFLRNSPGRNEVTITMDGQPQSVTLGPGEERLWPARPSPDLGAHVVEFTTTTGFRPSAVEAGNTDFRYLGCWVEVHLNE